jgi:uncharacterized protein
MTATHTLPVSLTSTWFIAPGREGEVIPALLRLAAAVHEGEPGTLAYLVHTPRHDEPNLTSLPPADPREVLFVEVYADAGAFLAHVNGPLFTTFVKDYGACFVQANGKPFTFVQFLDRRVGFIRPAAIPTPPHAGG